MTDATILLVSGSAVSIIGAIGGAAVLIIKALRETKAAVDTTQQLVNGHYGAVLKQLAEVKRVLADSTGRPVDMAGADAAEKTSDEHAARTALVLNAKET